MEFCRLFPEVVAGVVLMATFPQAETQEGKRSRHAMADRLLREGMRGYAEEVLSKMLAPRTVATRADIAAYVLDMMCGTDPAGAAAALRGRAERPSYPLFWRGVACNAFGRQAERALNHPSTTTREGAASSSPPGSNVLTRLSRCSRRLRVPAKRSGRAKFHLGLVAPTGARESRPSPNRAPRF